MGMCFTIGMLSEELCFYKRQVASFFIRKLHPFLSSFKGNALMSAICELAVETRVPLYCRVLLALACYEQILQNENFATCHFHISGNHSITYGIYC